MATCLTFALPELNLLNYAGDTAAIENTLTVPALAMLEGKQTSSSGQVKNYDRKLLESVTQASNDRMNKGRRVKLFGSEHKYSQPATVGYVVKPFELKAITQELLPHPGMTDLVGKLGIFTEIQISGRENVQSYLDGRLKELSSGIDFGGAFAGVKNAIYELSAVAFPAVHGASLYSQDETSTEPITEPNMKPLAEQLSQLASTMNSAVQSGAIDGNIPEVKTLVMQLGELQQAQTAEPAAAPEAETQTMSQPDPKTTALEQELATYKVQLATFQRQSQTRDRFDTLKRRAETLRGAGKITPAAFEDMFKPEAIATYSAEGSTDLDKIEFYLAQCEKYASSMGFGLATDGQPLKYSGATPSEAESDKTAEEFLNSYRLGR